MKILRNHLAKNPPDLIYHYTNLSGLCGIINESTLRLGNIYFQNDSSEMHEALNIFKESFRKRKYKYLKNTDKEKIINYVENSIINKICLMSFTSDGDMLSQWRSYSGFNGFSLGFDSKYLQSLGNDLQLASCVYIKKEQIELMEEFIDETFSDYEHNEKDIISEANIGAKAFSNLYFPIIKNRYFSEEKEWRIIKIDIDASNKNYIVTADSKMRVYANYKLDIPRVVKKIIIGPCSDKLLQEAFVRELLIKNNYTNIDKMIGFSKIPYRG